MEPMKYSSIPVLVILHLTPCTANMNPRDSLTTIGDVSGNHGLSTMNPVVNKERQGVMSETELNKGKSSQNRDHSFDKASREELKSYSHNDHDVTRHANKRGGESEKSEVEDNDLFFSAETHDEPHGNEESTEGSDKGMSAAATENVTSTESLDPQPVSQKERVHDKSSDNDDGSKTSKVHTFERSEVYEALCFLASYPKTSRSANNARDTGKLLKEDISDCVSAVYERFVKKQEGPAATDKYQDKAKEDKAEEERRAAQEREEQKEMFLAFSTFIGQNFEDLNLPSRLVDFNENRMFFLLCIIRAIGMAWSNSKKDEMPESVVLWCEEKTDSTTEGDCYLPAVIDDFFNVGCSDSPLILYCFGKLLDMKKLESTNFKHSISGIEKLLERLRFAANFSSQNKVCSYTYIPRSERGNINQKKNLVAFYDYFSKKEVQESSGNVELWLDKMSLKEISRNGEDVDFSYRLLMGAFVIMLGACNHDRLTIIPGKREYVLSLNEKVTEKVEYTETVIEPYTLYVSLKPTDSNRDELFLISLIPGKRIIAELDNLPSGELKKFADMQKKYGNLYICCIVDIDAGEDNDAFYKRVDDLASHGDLIRDLVVRIKGSTLEQPRKTEDGNEERKRKEKNIIAGMGSASKKIIKKVLDKTKKTKRSGFDDTQTPLGKQARRVKGLITEVHRSIKKHIGMKNYERVSFVREYNNDDESLKEFIYHFILPALYNIEQDRDDGIVARNSNNLKDLFEFSTRIFHNFDLKSVEIYVDPLKARLSFSYTQAETGDRNETPKAKVHTKISGVMLQDYHVPLLVNNQMVLWKLSKITCGKGFISGMESVDKSMLPARGVKITLSIVHAPKPGESVGEKALALKREEKVMVGLLQKVLGETCEINSSEFRIKESEDKKHKKND